MNDSITELFSRDPLKMSQQDLDSIIAYLRNARAQYNLGEKSAGNMKPTKAKKSPAEKVSSIDLSDLGL